MSVKTVEALEFECDGHYGLKKQVPVVTVNRSGERVSEMPNRWSSQAKDGETKHFCPTCTSLMDLMLYSPKRQLTLLASLTPDELMDFDLEDHYEKLEREDKERIKRGMNAK